RLDLARRDFRPQPRHYMQEARRAILYPGLGFLAKRCEYVGHSRQIKPRWGDPDHRIWFPVEDEVPADSRPITCKPALPKRVADDGNGRRARTILFGRKNPAVYRRHAKNREQSCRELAALHILGFARRADGASAVAPRRHAQ